MHVDLDRFRFRDSFRDWVQLRGLKLSSFKSFVEAAETGVLELFYEKTDSFFKANPSYADGKLVIETVIRLINNKQHDQIPKLILGDRFQWPFQLKSWITQITEIQNHFEKNRDLQLNKKSLKRRFDAKKSESLPESNDPGIQFKIRPVSNGVYVNAFVSSEDGMRQLLKVLQNTMQNMNSGPSEEQLFSDPRS
jgi:hypothetical protein